MARTRASDFEEKQHGILMSAAAVFAEQGMEKASMAQIATHSGVSKALLYHYYPSKDSLIFAIIHSHLHELEASVAAAIDPSLARGAAVAGAGRRRDREVPRRGRRAPGPAHRRGRAVGGAAQARSARWNVRSCGTSPRCCSEINPDLDRPERPLLMPVTMSLFGMMNWVYMWFRDGGLVTREDYAEVATTLILEGIKAVR